MTLYLTAAPDRLAQARAATAQLAHAAYRIGLGSQLLAAPCMDCWEKMVREKQH